MNQRPDSEAHYGKKLPAGIFHNGFHEISDAFLHCNDCQKR